MNPTADEQDPTAAITQKHTTTLHSLVSTLLTKLKPDTHRDSFASELNALAEQQGQDTKDILGCALRKAVTDVLIAEKPEESSSSAGFQHALSIVDISISLVRMRYVEALLPCTLLEHLFSFCTRAQLSAHINAIRERFALYRSVATTGSMQVYLIKALMSCINRDQKGSDSALSGRLRLMLAASLPVWHPSGMNKRGQINQNNDLDFESLLKDVDCPGLDVALYRSFWGVQKYMRNPSLAETAPAWELARKDMDTVLSAFETLECPGTSSTSHGYPNPKYMTAPSVLRLQIIDIRTRRHVLVQFAIFLHHLQVVGETARTEKERAPVVAKLNFCKSLFEEDGEGEQMKIRVYQQLERDSAGRFKRFIASILHREKRWIEWKRRLGYKHLNETGREAPKTLKRRKVLSPVPNVSGQTSKRKRTMAGTPDWISRQASWKVPPRSERMDPLLDPDRNPVPTIEALKEQLREDMEDPDITEDFKRKNDTKYAWRSLRMLCDESLETLVQVIDFSSKGGYDLELCVKKSGLSGSGSGSERVAEEVAAK